MAPGTVPSAVLPSGPMTITGMVGAWAGVQAGPGAEGLAVLPATAGSGVVGQSWGGG